MSDDYIRVLGPLTCSDGTTLPAVGVSNTALKPWTNAFPMGYMGVKAVFNAYAVYEMEVGGTSFASTNWPVAYTQDELKCPRGTLMAGLYGFWVGVNTWAAFVRLGLVCRQGECHPWPHEVPLQADTMARTAC